MKEERGRCKKEVGEKKAALPVMTEARPHSVKATSQFLEGSGPESERPSPALGSEGRCSASTHSRHRACLDLISQIPCLASQRR